MDTLLNPDPGLYIWTVVSFLILVGLLKAFAWGPLLKAVEEREERLRAERESAEAARRDAERIRSELAAQLAGHEARQKQALAEALREGEALRSRLKDDGEAEARRIVEKARGQLEEEKARLIGELRREVAALSVLAAERLVRKSVDKDVQKRVLDEFLGEVGGLGGRKG
ncbi:MAG: F0F1 ATP synthase subunit B [Elusimicrobiota bacterium]|jgi:F-type H+-transporting ATPase subunit b